MKINKNDFVRKLEAVKPGLSNKEIIEFSDSFGFVDNTIITYNDFICVKCPIDLDITGTVVADRFYKIIQQMKTDKEGNISLSIKDDNLIVKANKATAGIPINLEGQISLEELGKIPEKWLKLPKDFQMGIKMSAFSTSTDASQPILTCLNVNKNVIESNNGERGFKFFLDKKTKTSFLLPAFCVPALLNHPIKKYCVSDNWIHFKTKEGVIISSRMYADTDFPETDFLFDIKGKKFTFPIELKEVLDRAIIFIGEDEDQNVTVKVKKKVIEISSKSSSGWFKEKIKNKSKKEIEFKINPFFLKDILKENMTAIIHQGEELCLIKFSSANWQHVINISMD